ncbi:MAG: MYG1 family protein [Thermofilaceae archaeon]
MIKKIVSHKAPRHLDDFLTVAYLKALYPEAEIEFVHPQEVPEEYLKDPQVVVIDVGGKYEPELNNFDHHQNKDLPCSLVLFLKKIGIHQNTPFLNALSIIDTQGFMQAVSMGMVKPSKEIDEKRKVILMTPITEETAKVIYEVVNSALKENFDFDQLIESLWNKLSFTQAFQLAYTEYTKQKEQFKEKLNQIIFQKIDDLLIAYSKESLAPYHSDFFSEYKVNLLIETNSMNNTHTSLIVNTSSPLKDKAFELREKILAVANAPIVFRHPNQFIVVVDKKIDEFNNLISEFQKTTFLDSQKQNIHVQNFLAPRKVKK